MSRLTDLIAKVKDQDLRRLIEKEIKHLSQRLSFGLNFERHIPESVDLYGREIRLGDKVRVLPSRDGAGESKQSGLWQVIDLPSLNATGNGQRATGNGQRARF